MTIGQLPRQNPCDDKCCGFPNLSVHSITDPETEQTQCLPWVPASFIGDLHTIWYLEQAVKPRVEGYPTPEGLRNHVPGFLLNSGFLNDDSSFNTLLVDYWLPLQDE